MLLNNFLFIIISYFPRILNELKELAASRFGECVLFDLIELVQDNLTQNNMPAGNCPICLESFSVSHTICDTVCDYVFLK